MSFTRYDLIDPRPFLSGKTTAIANAVLLLFEKESDSSVEAGAQKQNAEKIKRFIDENYHKKITVNLVSDEFFLSKDYVRNLFIKFYGVSPKSYIQNVRMERAKKLLSKTQISIALIANSVGYDDPLLFSKMFKKYYSVSPSEFRGEWKEKR